MELTDVTLRRLDVGDQALLWEALYLALWDAPDEPRRPREVLRRPEIACYVASWGSQPDDEGWIALAQGRPVGAVWSRLLLPPLPGGAFYDEKTPQLGIAVFPRYRGRGIGELLFDRHLVVLAERYPRVALGVHPRNTIALRLYRKHGFTQFATAPGGYLNMVRELNHAGDRPGTIGGGSDETDAIDRC